MKTALHVTQLVAYNAILNTYYIKKNAITSHVRMMICISMLTMNVLLNVKMDNMKILLQIHANLAILVV